MLFRSDSSYLIANLHLSKFAGLGPGGGGGSTRSTHVLFPPRHFDISSVHQFPASNFLQRLAVGTPRCTRKMGQSRLFELYPSFGYKMFIFLLDFLAASLEHIRAPFQSVQYLRWLPVIIQKQTQTSNVPTQFPAPKASFAPH